VATKAGREGCKQLIIWQLPRSGLVQRLVCFTIGEGRIGIESVEGNRYWRTDSREIALLEVGSDALAEAIGAHLARGIERGLGTWEGCGFVLPSGRDAEHIRYRQSTRPQEFVLRIDRSDDPTAALVEVLAALKLSSSCVTWVAPSPEAG